jgi:hypothetical protein
MATVKKMTRFTQTNENPDDPNVRDPKHKHELGGTLGMTVGGVAGGIAAGAAAGAAIGGASAGPIGAVAGAAIGGALGGSAGEDIARAVNPTAEEKYWEDNYQTRTYFSRDRGFDVYRPAYRYGIDSYTMYQGRDFKEIEPNLRDNWYEARGNSSLEWNDAREPARDAYERLKKTPR